MQTPRRTAVVLAAAVMSGVLVLSACGGSGGSSTDTAASGGPVELTVGLFGTFGYDEVGLFKEYESQNPGVTIKYESTQGEDKYWPALQTRLASGSGVADVQGIEVARISDVVTNQPDQWTDLRDTPAADAISRYIGWKEPAATTPDGAVLGLGTDIGPMGICYRSDLLQQAGLPTDPAALSAEMPDWNAFLALGERFKASAPAGTSWHDSAGGLYNAIVSQQKQIYYGQSGDLVFDSNPAVRSAFDTAARAGQSGLTAKLEQFVDPGWDQGFSSGSFATIACPSWMIGYIKGKAGDGGSGKWNVTSLPGGAGGNWGGAYLGIPQASQHKDEAAKLIAWLTAPEQQARVFREVGNFPSTTQAIASVTDTTDPYFNNAPIGKIFSDSAQNAPVQILGPQDGVIKNAMVQALLSVETTGAAPDTAWNTAVGNVKNQVG
ncbi:extracellular solute-binding protein [Pseudonocardia xinjiangensis]|uniref:ABC transporter substrate-binding protein n=1 Tax=Pseudonocardia xinjiangensis TaxID=75289 RepID=UPI003D8D8290